MFEKPRMYENFSARSESLDPIVQDLESSRAYIEVMDDLGLLGHLLCG